MSDHERRALLRALSGRILELFPARGVDSLLDSLPPAASVAVTCSERHGIDATLELTEQLVRAGFRVVPHISARQVTDKAHLARMLHRLRSLGVEDLFVPGGDAERPAGPFGSALELLQAMEGMDHGIASIGVAAYPEGHPLIESEDLFAQLAAKQSHAAYMVTQMCFDPADIAGWLIDVRARGIELPVRIGLPGVLARKRLLATALQIGVGPSASYLRKQRGLAGHILATPEYKPEELLNGLASVISDPAMGVAGLHVFTLNQVAAFERWLVPYIQRLEAGA